MKKCGGTMEIWEFNFFRESLEEIREEDIQVQIFIINFPRIRDLWNHAKLQSAQLRNRAFRISKFVFGNEISRAAENFLQHSVPTNFIRKKYEWLPEITVYWYRNLYAMKLNLTINDAMKHKNGLWVHFILDQ